MEGENPSPALSPAATRAPTPLERLATDLLALRQKVNSSLAGSEKIRMIEGYLARARRVAADAGKPPPEIEAAERLLREIRAELDLEMRGAFEELEAQVMEILNSPSPEHQRAEFLVSRFPADRFPGTDIDKRLGQLGDRILLYQNAEVDYLNRTSFIQTFGNDYARRIGHLEGFDPDYDVTPYGAKIRELIEKEYQLFIEARRVEDEAAGAAVSQRWKLSDYRWEGPADFPIAYDNNEKVLSMGPNPEDYEEKERTGSYVMFGDGTWIDVRITFEARLRDPANVKFAAKGRTERGRDTFLPLSLAGLELPDDPEKWHQFVVVVQRNTFEVTCVTAETSVKSTHDLTGIPGDFVVQILGSAATVALKAFEYSVSARDTSQLGTEEEPGAEGGDDKDGKGKGDEGEGGGEDGTGGDGDGER